MTLTVLDAGPIPLEAIERYDDPDVETALENAGIVPGTATFRLVEVPLRDLEDVRWLPGPRRWDTFTLEALRAGAVLPPVVVVATERHGGSFGLLDGLHRTHAHWVLRRPTIRAYDLLPGYQLA